ncbi:MAG: hypothetical protein HN576_01670 [Bacteriovoracaceae bacterium]|jgi:hypothetical protein|nr:hypothetical protein [Bacteriovoracaceae bacterium]
MKNLFFLFTLMLIITACKSNPYPQDGGVIVNGKQPNQRPTAPAYSIDVLPTLVFREGMTNNYRVNYFVPTGNPIIKFGGLPDGMIFDEIEKKLIWTPSYTAANDAQVPSVKVRRFPVVAWLRSDLDTRTFIKKEFVVEVNDTPRLFKTTNIIGPKTITEGQTHSFEFDFSNEDFPAGPFTVATKYLPQSLNVNIENNTKVSVNFVANSNFVTVDDSCSYYSCKKKFEDGIILITAPDGRILEVPYDFTVNDKRLLPVFVNPTTITQGLDVNFIVSSYDKNGEIEPRVTLQNAPRAGSVAFEKVTANKSNLFQTHMKLTWKDIPADRRGTSFTFRFRSCVYDHRRNMNECENQNVEVNIEEQNHKAPVLVRSNWPLGQIEYLKVNKQFTATVDVRDGDDNSRSVTNVVIEPKEMQKLVSFKYKNLVVKAYKPGLYQFNLRATSIYGIESVESFVFEVLPEKWSETIALVSNPRNLENIKTKGLFRSVDFINPDLQSLGRRTLSHRKTLFLGTDVLKNNDLIKNIEKLSQKMKNIIIMSPLIENLKNELKEEISKLGILQLGRFSDNVIGELSSFNFLIGRDVNLTHPKWKIRLSGTLTGQSFNPVLLKRKITSSCTEALSLGNEVTGMDYLTTLRCNRENGGYLLISSFEFGDFATHADDKDIPRNWLSTLTE